MTKLTHITTDDTVAGDLTGNPLAPVLVATGVTAGTYTNPTLAVDAKGRVTSAANGTGGTGNTTDLADSTVSAPGALQAGKTNNVTAAGTYTAPTPDAAVATPPKRFAIFNQTTGPVTLSFPNISGATISLTVLAGEVVTFRQKSNSGYGNESGNKPLAQLDARYVQPAALAPVATSGSYTDLTNKPATYSPTDASTSAKGVVQLAGDLAGTAAAPTVPGLAAKQAISSLPHVFIAASTASTKQKALADYTATGTGDHTTIQTAINAVITAGGGIVELGAGTFNVTAQIAWAAHNVGLVGQGQDSTKIINNSGSANFDMIKIGNRQTDGVLRNSNVLADMTVSHAGGASTKSVIWVDGGGRGSTVRNVRTNEGSIGVRFTDLDRYSIQNLDVNNPRAVAIQYEAGAEGTFGKVAMRDSSMNLSDANSVCFKAISLVSTNPFDSLVFENNLFFSTNGVAGTIGAQFTLAAIDTVFIGGQFESPSLAHIDINTSNDSRIKLVGVSFIQNNATATTSGIRLNGANHALTIDTCNFQNVTTVFNAVGGYSNLDFSGWNKNNGNIGAIFAGNFGLRHGSDTAFVGNGALYLGTDNERYENAFLNQLRIVRGSAATGKVWTGTNASGDGDWQALPDATTSAKGVVQLAGDLAGTAASPTVPGLASKVTDLADVTISSAGALQAGKTNNVTVAGTFTAPTPAASVTTPPQRFSVLNQYTSSITVSFPNLTGATVNLAVLPGETVTFRQKNTSGYANEYGNKPLSQLDLRYLYVYNVKNYGAKGDGTTDDSAAIRATISAASTAGGGQVIVPAGTYIVSGTGTPSDGVFAIPDNIEVIGAGIGKTIFKLANNPSADITGIFRTPTGVSNKNVTLRDFSIDGNGANVTAGIRIVGFYCGVTPGSATSDYDIRCYNVEIHHCTGYGFDPHERTTRLVLSHCISHDNGFGGNPYDGFTLDGQYEALVIGCVAYSNNRYGLNLTTASTNCRIIGCEFYGNGAGGGTIANGSKYNAVTGNIFHDNALDGIFINGLANGATGAIDTTAGGFNTVSGNLIERSGNNGIYVFASSYNNITGNEVVDSSQATTNTYAQIAVAESGTNFSLHNFVSGNNLVITATNVPKYGLYEQSVNEDYNVFIANKIQAGSGTADTSIVGTNSKILSGHNTSADSHSVLVPYSIPNGNNITLATGTGTMIGTASTQKLGFLGTTPVVQQTATTDLGSVLASFGFRAAGGAYPFTTTGAVAFNGPITNAPTTRTASTTLSATSGKNQLCDATSAAYNVTLPDATTVTGRTFTIKKIDSSANAITVKGNGTQVIDGSNTKALTAQYQSIEVVTDGTAWYII